MFSNFDAIRISIKQFEDTIINFNSHKPFYGLQNIHKLLCGYSFAFQYPQNWVFDMFCLHKREGYQWRN